jgi:predicted small lipoprotein YifL
MKKLLLTALLLSLTLSACGKVGALEYDGERKQPKFDKIIDEDL